MFILPFTIKIVQYHGILEEKANFDFVEKPKELDKTMREIYYNFKT
jgi:hypothetical protein